MSMYIFIYVVQLTFVVWFRALNDELLGVLRELHQRLNDVD